MPPALLCVGVISPAVLCSLPVGAEEETVELIQDSLSVWVQQGMEKWSEKVKVIVSLESSGGSQGSESSTRSRRSGTRIELDVGKKVPRVFRFQKWTNSRRFKTRVGFGGERKWGGGEMEVKVIGGEVKKELGG